MLDLIFSIVLLVLLSPFLLVITVLVWVKLGNPVVFKQRRVGKHEKIFAMYKYRTMTDERDDEGALLSDELRLTRFGKILRDFSIDELPELVNIVKGDMSFVGPRPLVVEYIERYDERQRHRHDVDAGLTGLAQINGRNAIDWDKKLELDVQYTEAMSFKNDWKILLKTVRKVFKREGITDGESVTTSEFMGKGD